jgi:hypothetical protein
MINRIVLGMFLMTIMIVTSCSSEDNGGIIIDTANIQQISETAKSGTWRITSFIDSGKNETAHFVGYDFTFNDNGTITASNGSNSINGTWSVSNGSSSNSSNIDFDIAFASPNNFEELSEDWDIISISNAKIDLIHISGGNGGTDTLTFEKQ